MKIKTTIYIFLIIFLLINTFSTLYSNSYASLLEEAIQSARGFEKEDNVKTTAVIPITVDKLQSVSKKISSVLFAISVLIAIITTATVGINLMIQSAEEKAKTKEAMVPLVIGMLVSFGAYGIWKIMVNILEKIQQ